MDTVFIEGLQIDALIGIHAWERDGRQPLVFDIEMTFDNRIPAASDDVAQAVDYAAVVQAMREFVGGRADSLLETLGEAACAMLLARFRIESVRLRVGKPQAAQLLGCAAVGITLQRDRPADARPGYAGG